MPTGAAAVEMMDINAGDGQGCDGQDVGGGGGIDGQAVSPAEAYIHVERLSGPDVGPEVIVVKVNLGSIRRCYRSAPDCTDPVEPSVAKEADG